MPLCYYKSSRLLITPPTRFAGRRLTSVHGRVVPKIVVAVNIDVRVVVCMDGTWVVGSVRRSLGCFSQTPRAEPKLKHAHLTKYFYDSWMPKGDELPCDRVNNIEYRSPFYHTFYTTLFVAHYFYHATYTTLRGRWWA